ncbi:unnamed protein product [Musa acuminata subsp. malaccensis]|uniref:(wild Malaysian banana) hypothetical protein n=1 Tax=Musa acuminata subsp. malaccensis TaxID=214687 RepID=A0A8D7A3H4_MUSAM|nr:unnamed protein product [Musa acuminata subsp. malaccensis]
MGKNCKSGSHRLFKAKAKNRVDDLQGMFNDLQSARKESRIADIAVLEEQVHQMLREWRAELNEVSPACSLQGNVKESSDLFSETLRLLQLSEEEDDATSKPAELALRSTPKPEELDVSKPGVGYIQGRENAAFQDVNVDLGLERMEIFQVPSIFNECLEKGFAPTIHLLLNCSFDNIGFGSFWIPCSGLFGPELHTYPNQDYYVNQEISGHEFPQVYQYESNLPIGPHDVVLNCLEGTTYLDYQLYNLQQEMADHLYDNISVEHDGADVFPHMSDLLPTICPPPSAFLRPKCALWDCPRPAQGSEWCQDYCSSFHANLAVSEGPPGMTPVLRPGGIDLKDGPLFAALNARTEGKNVGIPVCEGAATAKSPWNAPELFDLSVLEGESLREWLFFDKPRRAFESGNRKQRSLPDYCGRGWHESRKQILKEYGGFKRSYYMDPQPLNNFEWHMYEYEINNCDAFALYRLEFKLVDPKKGAKAKLTSNPLADFQQQMVKLNSNKSMDNKKITKNKTKVNQDTVGNSYSTSVVANQQETTASVFHASEQVDSSNKNSACGPSHQYVYSIGSFNDDYIT